MLNTTQKITFKQHYTFRQFDKSSVILISERERYLLRGHIYIHVAPLLNGSYSADEIVIKLLNKAPPERTYHALILLEREGHIAPLLKNLPKEHAAFWYSIGVNTLEAASRLNAIKIAIRTIGCSKQDAKQLSSSLGRLGITTDNIERSDLVVAIVNDYLHPQLESYNLGRKVLGCREIVPCYYPPASIHCF